MLTRVAGYGTAYLDDGYERGFGGYVGFTIHFHNGSPALKARATHSH
jgi:hypothetical protein